MNWNDEADVLAHIEDDLRTGAFDMITAEKTYTLYVNKYRYYIVEEGIGPNLGIAMFVDRMNADSPETAMNAWSVVDNTLIPSNKAGLWETSFEMFPRPQRDYYVSQRTKKQ